jgi:hypothetical protein
VELVLEGESNSTEKVLTTHLASILRLIVIMLFRLRMPIDQAIKAYVELASHVFSEKKLFFQEGTFKASRLEKGITDIIASALSIEPAEANQVRMIIEESNDGAKGQVGQLI